MTKCSPGFKTSKYCPAIFLWTLCLMFCIAFSSDTKSGSWSADAIFVIQGNDCIPEFQVTGARIVFIEKVFAVSGNFHQWHSRNSTHLQFQGLCFNFNFEISLDIITDYCSSLMTKQHNSDVSFADQSARRFTGSEVETDWTVVYFEVVLLCEAIVCVDDISLSVDQFLIFAEDFCRSISQVSWVFESLLYRVFSFVIQMHF